MPTSTLRTYSPETDRRYRTRLAAWEMPAEFRQRVFDVAAFAPLLERFDQSQSNADRDAIIRHLLPLVMKLALLRRKYRRWCKDELDELVSDACLVLPSLIKRYHALPAGRFLELANAAIRGVFMQGQFERRGLPHTFTQRQILWRRFQQRFFRMNRRRPTEEEKQAYLATLPADPALDVKPRLTPPIAFSAMKDAGVISEDSRAVFVDRKVPAFPLLERDIIQFAMKGLRGTDRTIFKLAVLEGLSNSEIARRVGSNRVTISYRVNLILWQCRCRRDLARALGVEPAQRMIRRENGNPAAISVQPPARLVA